MSSDELLQVARSIRKDETPSTFHRVICELGRRGASVDYDELGHGEVEEQPISERITRQLRTAGSVLRLFVVEASILLLLGAALVVLMML